MAMKVSDYMSTSLQTLSADSSLQDAVLLQMRKKLRHIPIIDDKKLVGIVTDRDLRRAMPSLLSGIERSEYERVMGTTQVSQIMTRSPVTIRADAPLEDAARIMVEKRLGALPVVQDKRLLGILNAKHPQETVVQGEDLAFLVQNGKEAADGGQETR